MTAIETRDGRQEAGPSLFTPTGLDALAPPEVARKAESIGIAKASMPAVTVFVLAVLAGAFIALGAVFATSVAAGGSELPFGVVRLLAGLTFTLGLILVVVAGAELFTGNNLIVMAWAGRRVTTARLAGNWTLVWIGNFVGALGTALLVFVAKQYEFGGGAVGEAALSIAAAKTDLGFVQAVALGMLCNALVCLAVWLTYGAHTTTDKIIAVIPPIAAFVAAGFEHSIANMYFISIGLLVKSDDGFVAGLESPPDLSTLDVEGFLVGNLLPVTIGNVIGGAVMVGGVYWFVYLRPRSGEEGERA
jgi:formate transporter